MSDSRRDMEKGVRKPGTGRYVEVVPTRGLSKSSLRVVEGRRICRMLRSEVHLSCGVAVRYVTRVHP